VTSPAGAGVAVGSFFLGAGAAGARIVYFSIEIRGHPGNSTDALPGRKPSFAIG
jgi:hypothetical protein